MIRLVAAGLIAALLATGGATQAAAAAPTRTAFTCTEVIAQQPSEGVGWPAGQTFHIRGWTAVYDTVGDPLCAGRLFVVADIDFTSGRGGIRGTATYVLDELQGGWIATFEQAWDYPVRLTEGTVVGLGYGDLAGWQLRSRLFEAFDQVITETGLAWAPGR
jgi:hypothetical protein